MIKAIFFDLDGTLLPMDEKKFTYGYFQAIYDKVKDLGYDKNQLIDTILKGTEAMYRNNGIKSNEEVFWEYFVSVYGKDKLKDKVLFDDFYKNEFYSTKQYCNDNPLAKDIVKYCNDNFEYVLLTTNPIFPYDATKARMSFVDLNPSDFDLITTYENSSYTKPNPKYFKTILEKYNLKSDEIIYFGNNTLEDGECALSLGIKTYLVKGNIIYDPKARHEFEEISMEEIIPTIKTLLSK